AARAGRTARARRPAGAGRAARAGRGGAARLDGELLARRAGHAVVDLEDRAAVGLAVLGLHTAAGVRGLDDEEAALRVSRDGEGLRRAAVAGSHHQVL